VSGQFVPVILTEGDGRVFRYLRAIETSAEFGLTLALSLDEEIVGSIANSWVRPRSDDPVYAAIERHKEACTAFNAECGKLDEIEGEPTREAVAPYNAANEAEHAARLELAETTPTTRDGASAALAYLTAGDGLRHYPEIMAFAAMLIEAKWPTSGAAPSPTV
jgi:hypothetical protein